MDGLLRPEVVQQPAYKRVIQRFEHSASASRCWWMAFPGSPIARDRPPAPRSSLRRGDPGARGELGPLELASAACTAATRPQKTKPGAVLEKTRVAVELLRAAPDKGKE
jgi:hypothetical protein